MTWRLDKSPLRSARGAFAITSSGLTLHERDARWNLDASDVPKDFRADE